MTNPYSLSEATARYDEALTQRIDHNMNVAELPIIGVTTNLGTKGAELARGYYESVRRAGGVPFLLAPTDDPQELIAQLEQVDGLLLSGGGDINPLWLGEDPMPELHSICPERDLYELQLCRMAHQRNIPVMGICRGCQVMAAALGGKVMQDIGQVAGLIKHSQDAPREEATHWVRLTDREGILSGLEERQAVNSFHHQAISEPGPLMHTSAVASDGVIEAVEGNLGESFLLGVQWHPECMSGSSLSQHLFRAFVAAAESYCRALELHASILTLDSHCDTPMMFPAMIAAEEEHTGQPVDELTWLPDLCHRNPHCLVDAVKAAEGHLDETFMVSYIPQGPRTPEGYADARHQVELTHQRLQHILHGQLPYLYVHFGIENGYALGQDLSLVAYYHDQCQVEYITLVHNGHNDICDSARPKQGEPQEEWGGLSPFGREVIGEMNRCGVLIDLSHASEQTFYQTLELSRKPVAVTHACCRALCDHPRNLTDEQLRAIAQKDGVVQCTMYHGFLRNDDKEATIEDFMQHLEHMIEVCGIDHVGIGSDFDGDGGVAGLRDASDVLHITERLLQRGYTDNDICKIWGDNFRRVLAAQSL
ncbi:MAG: membrane dipeptidase [Bacteroidaceae bacterium]|nr:membrane dipeptidase [Bacteroidaceae bacterium]